MKSRHKKTKTETHNQTNIHQLEFIRMKNQSLSAAVIKFTSELYMRKSPSHGTIGHAQCQWKCVQSMDIRSSNRNN